VESLFGGIGLLSVGAFVVVNDFEARRSHGKISSLLIICISR